MNKYSVGQVNAYIKNLFTQDYFLRSIIVVGEVSKVTYQASGHVYFTMKDKTGVLSCVMFAGNAKKMTTKLEKGMQIEATGSVSVYEATGVYQLYVSSFCLAGIGELYAKYEALKEELAELGMFDKQYKREIPRFVRRIGVVTSPTGAVIHDIQTITARRNPHVEIVLYPSLVQGISAKESIVKGIKTLEQQDIDVMIVGRGGGSIEDLWAFNERCVAEAIFDCSIPVITAIGHETDTTIADFVADRRAATPSEAAELAVFDYYDFVNDLQLSADGLKQLVERKITQARSVTENYSLKLEKASPQNQLKLKKLKYEGMAEKLDQLMRLRVDGTKNKLSLYIERYKALSPLEKIQNGFSAVTGENGNKITHVSEVNPGDLLKLTMRSGIIKARAESISEYDLNDPV